MRISYGKTLHLLQDPLSSYRLTLPMLGDGPRPSPLRYAYSLLHEINVADYCVRAVMDDRPAFTSPAFRELPALTRECLFTDCHVDFMPTMGWDPPTCNTSGFGTWTIVAKGTRLFFILLMDEKKVPKPYKKRRCDLLQKGRELELDYQDTPAWIATNGAIDLVRYGQASVHEKEKAVGKWYSVLAGEGDLL